MKRKNKLFLMASSVGFLWLTATLSAQPTDFGLNRAVLASPRTLEQFPEVLRTRRAAEGTVVRSISPADRLVQLSGSGASAASPRFREENPELLRVSPSRAASLVRAANKTESLTVVVKNGAVANSPRFLEEHPEVPRAAAVIQIAPLK